MIELLNNKFAIVFFLSFLSYIIFILLYILHRDGRVFLVGHTADALFCKVFLLALHTCYQTSQSYFELSVAPRMKRFHDSCGALKLSQQSQVCIPVITLCFICFHLSLNVKSPGQDLWNLLLLTLFFWVLPNHKGMVVFRCFVFISGLVPLLSSCAFLFFYYPQIICFSPLSFSDLFIFRLIKEWSPQAVLLHAFSASHSLIFKVCFFSVRNLILFFFHF